MTHTVVNSHGRTQRASNMAKGTSRLRRAATLALDGTKVGFWKKPWGMVGQFQELVVKFT